LRVAAFLLSLSIIHFSSLIFDLREFY